MLTIQNQPELFWVRALLDWSCAHLLASKLFMKQILKRRLSARPHLICPESRIDAQASSLSPSLSPSLSLSLSLQFKDSDKFLSFCFSTTPNAIWHGQKRKDRLEKTHFFSLPFMLPLIYWLRQLCICGLKKGVPEPFRQGQFTDFGNVPSLFHAPVLGNVVTV